MTAKINIHRGTAGNRVRNAWQGTLIAIAALTLAAFGGCSDSSSLTGSGTASSQIVVSQADATRMLEQSSFGATAQDIAHLQSVGFDAYLNEQFATAPAGYSGFAYVTHDAPTTCQNDGTATSAASRCARDNYSLFQVQRRFFQNALSGADQLRQRVAFALSQIFVVSGTEIYEAYGMAAYQNMLLRDAFGNFRSLLNDVTLSPVMGNYLDMVNNGKANPASGTTPNENYARELLQLFSIGVNMLNIDGSVQTDARGRPIPAYNEDVIEGYAYLFTGWAYPPRPGAASQWANPINYEGTMVSFASHHDTGPKLILQGRVLPGGQTPEQDLADGLDAVFNHPNVGPFIGKQLIQHLVTSNPSPQYITRVATVFNNNGQGVRGDMRAVIRAILLDPEARGDAKTDPNYGHLREPALFITSILRNLGGRSDGVYLRSQAISLQQNLFTPSSVFNYFPPSYVIPGTTSLGPEFGIQDTISVLNRANFVYQLVYSNGVVGDPTVTGST
ncbi:MAG: DUF1800 family protein, partial [Sulfuricaulis sp.]|uniref:DUF1800 domain-containing protein n=1 Tax=Sulfuricaulis sp. TaxID=2003553 RepID=UPI003C4DD562